MDISTARLNRLKQLLELEQYAGRGGQARLAADIGRAPAQVSQWINGTRSINEESARNIEQRLRLPALWMDGDAPLIWPFTRISPERWAQISADQRSRIEAMIAVLVGADEVALMLPSGAGRATVVPGSGSLTVSESHAPPYLSNERPTGGR